MRRKDDVYLVKNPYLSRELCRPPRVGDRGLLLWRACGFRRRPPQVSVQRKCGDPDTTEWRITYRALPIQDPYSGDWVTVYTPVAIEVWLYNFGPQRFMEELSFESGRLVSIQPLGYGYE